MSSHYIIDNKYGVNRSLQPENVLPTSAWKVDNSRIIMENEIRIAIKKIQIEGTSFRQICMECNDNDEYIKEKIIDIIIQRGKLHNPVTDTGGVLCGEIEEIGIEYKLNSENLKKGDEVICNASLASVPIFINRIGRIDRVFNQIEVEGYAIAYNEIPIIKKPHGLPVNLMLYVFNESGTLFSIAKHLEENKNILVVGTNLLMNLIFGYTVRKILKSSGRIDSLLDVKNKTIMKGEKIDVLLEEIFDKMYYGDILNPVESINEIGEEKKYDLIINCSEFPGAEPVSVLSAKYGGTVVFTNLIYNYNSALYITESISKQLEIVCPKGYLEKYDDFNLEIIGELASYFKEPDSVFRRPEKEDDDVENERNNSLVAALPEDFVSKSNIMNRILDDVIKYAKYDCNILISGDSGVGKEKIANIIQKSSNRKMQPFIKVNCAAVPHNLLESEFFGYERGAFTGANTMGKKGFFELADNGILFLDEIAELPMEMQAKLLRVIQEGEFYKVGGTKPIITNLRIISATNKELEASVDNGEFRRDLYYRLNVVSVKIPSLKERKEDVPPLVKSFLKKYGTKFDIKKDITEDAIKCLQEHTWRGNVRELENTMQRIIISSKTEKIEMSDVLRVIHDDKTYASDEVVFDGREKAIKLNEIIENYEGKIIKSTYEKYGSTRKAAEALGISQTQFVRKKNKYNA